MDNQETFMEDWLSIDTTMNKIKKETESILQANYKISIKEFYVLYYISKSPDKKLRLQQLQEKIGLSQSALSRLVAGMESSSCGALEKSVCTDDRRGTYTKLTELGETTLKKALQDFRGVVENYLSLDDLETSLNRLKDEF
ncbi:MarR family winged helix-turn-helix transcriptional regulator [Lysinibacillus sp. NPDC058147]|uniref:MarR family winged helix-turn-helix transcriptional regulator n=1 Tax=unclassified Lysinibacillus TaxID=2636778 RepID=UPI0036D95808